MSLLCNNIPICLYYTLTVLVFMSSARTVQAIEMLKAMQSISVENGSTSGVIIDCPYQLGKDDTDGLVIKWYFNNASSPVYQWIPGNEPQDLGILTDRLDKLYTVSPAHFMKHRALAIVEPTTELSGRYTCVVSSFTAEANAVAHLLVYIAASRFFISVEETQSVNISCVGEGPYPEPELKLYRVTSQRTNTLEKKRDLIDDVITHSEFYQNNGTYSVLLTKQFESSDFGSSAEFVCILHIPNTDYKVEKVVLYHANANSADVLQIKITQKIFPIVLAVLVHVRNKYRFVTI